MDPKVLVVWATKYGATAQIAEKIGQVLRDAGLRVDLLPADEVSDLSPFTSIVLGSAVYAGQWRKEAVQVLVAHEEALTQRPVCLFSSGPTGEGDPVALLQGWSFPEALRPIANRIAPKGTVFFHGNIDMEKLNLAEKLVVKGMKAPTGDYRDWETITSWAQSIADAARDRAA